MREGMTYNNCTRCRARVPERKCLKCGTRDSFTWAYVVDIAAPSEARRQRKQGGFATRGDAQTAMSNLQVQKAEGTYVDPSKLTVGDYLDQWLAGDCGGHVRPLDAHGLPDRGQGPHQAQDRHCAAPEARPGADQGSVPGAPHQWLQQGQARGGPAWTQPQDGAQLPPGAAYGAGRRPSGWPHPRQPRGRRPQARQGSSAGDPDLVSRGAAPLPGALRGRPGPPAVAAALPDRDAPRRAARASLARRRPGPGPALSPPAAGARRRPDQRSGRPRPRPGGA